MGTCRTRIGAWAAATALGVATLTGQPSEAAAEGPVVGTSKGIVGGALLGGELVALGMGAFGVSKGWTYLVFPPLAAVGGGIGGYFIEQSAPPAEVPLYMLAGGMALVIPTIIVTLNATIYKAPENYPNEPVQNQPAGEPALPRVSKRPIHVPMSLVDVHEGRFAMGVPALEIRPMYTPEEMAKFGVAQGREVKIPVFQASF
ncbi:hypothetical protein GF068_23945 [Polyangium spumosum]|uniref:Uncharacterized protein n=1 Tax=Polyangium spumosum TaxID=889282 RepID=A0A6N7PSP6_9BACT|nr:hypothetical protein [Polyangium spumosum]MRG94949.1 hypothetical protein [Polyangium spumosum]